MRVLAAAQHIRRGDALSLLRAVRETETREYAVVVFFYVIAALVRPGGDLVHAHAHFLRRGLRHQPAVAYARRAPQRRFAAPAYPYRRHPVRREYRLGAHGHIVQREMPPVKGDIVLLPQQPHHLDSLFGSADAPRARSPARLILIGVLSPKADGRQTAPVGQEIQRCNLLGEYRGIA